MSVRERHQAILEGLPCKSQKTWTIGAISALYNKQVHFSEYEQYINSGRNAYQTITKELD